jgi:hypothetical protein
MNIKFKLKNLDIEIPNEDAKVYIEEIEYEVTDANPMEVAQALRESLKAVAEFKREIEDDIPIKTEPIQWGDINSGDEQLITGRFPSPVEDDFINDDELIAEGTIAPSKPEAPEIRSKTY